MSAKLFFTESAFDKSKQEELQFEYLKEWISSAHQRTVVDTEPPGSACPFQSLAKAITHAYSLPTEHLTEERVRAILVKTYKDLNETDLQRVASAKLEEKTSFFCMTAAFRDVQAVREYWNWYLYCLTHRTAEIYDDDCNAGVVRMPLDNVDLQVLASFFCTGIVVSKLDSCALKFLPGSGRAPKAAIHLLNHKSLWAPMLGKKPTTNELHGQLVQLQALEGGPFHDFTNKAGLVVRDQSQQLFYKVNVGQHHLPIEPHQLHVIRDQIAPMFERSSSSTRGWQLGSPLGHAPSFRGIPDGSVEFQILLELVGVLRLHQFSIQANGFLLDIMAMASNLEAMAQWPPSGPKSNGMGQFLV